MTINLDETRLYLAVLCQTDDPDNVPMMWRAIWRTRDSYRPRIIKGTLAQQHTYLEQLNEDGWGIYVQVNPGEGTKDKHITDVRAHFVDNDHGVLPADYPAGLEPSMFVDSGRGQHAYWVTPANVGDSTEHFKKRQLLLASAMYTDEAICNLSRVMRVPGFMWTKPDDREQWRMVTCTPADGDALAPRPARDLITGLTAPPNPPTADWALYRIGNLATMVRAAPEGTSQNTFNRAAYEAKDYVAAGLVDVRVARDVLFTAARDRGVEGAEATWESASNAPGVSPATPMAVTTDPADLAGTMMFESANDHDVAKAIVEDWGGPERVAVVGGRLYLYSEATGVWEAVNDIVEVRGMVGEYHMTPYLTPAGKPSHLRIGTALRRKITDSIMEDRSIQRPDATAALGVGFANGFLTPAGELVPHAPEHFATHRFDFDWGGDGGDAVSDPPPKWRKFLSEVWGDVSVDSDEFLLRAGALASHVGLALLGLGPRHAVVLIMEGDGANGKSVLLDAVAGCLGRELVSYVHPETWADPYYKMGLRPPVRLNVVSELPEGEWFASHQFKSIVGGDEVSARLPYGLPQTFRPQCAHIMACNSLPGSSDRSGGFWRRINLLPMPVSFEGRAANPRVLVEGLVSERREFIEWVLGWGLFVEKEGERPVSEFAQEAKEEWRLANDPVRMWVDECLEVVNYEDTSLTAAQCYQSYSVWCAMNGLRARSSNWWGRQMKRLGIAKKRVRRGDKTPWIYGVKER